LTYDTPGKLLKRELVPELTIECNECVDIDMYKWINDVLEKGAQDPASVFDSDSSLYKSLMGRGWERGPKAESRSGFAPSSSSSP